MMHTCIEDEMIYNRIQYMYYNAGIAYSKGSLALSHASQSDLVVLQTRLANVQ